MKYVDVVFDGPPAPESGRFVELESPAGTGIRFGEWIDRGDGYWALRIPIVQASSIETKTFEIRDKGTFIPAIASRIAPFELAKSDPDRYLMRRSGYGEPLVILTALEAHGSAAHCDPQDWNGRTWPVAHKHIADNWFELGSGAVIDVEFILGEKPEPKKSERLETPADWS